MVTNIVQGSAIRMATPGATCGPRGHRRTIALIRTKNTVQGAAMKIVKIVTWLFVLKDSVYDDRHFDHNGNKTLGLNL